VEKEVIFGKKHACPMPEQHADQRYIEGLARNDYGVLKEIRGNCLGILTRWILDNSGSREDAEDIFNDVLLAIYDRMSKPKPLVLTRPFSAYLMGIARNKWFEVLRKRKKETKVRNDQAQQYTDERDESIEEELVAIETASERNRQLEKTFVQLSERCQQLIDMVFNRGLSTEEIVTALEFNTDNAFYVRKKKCLDRWRTLIVELKK
jgi:RNA polymerase sigma factor (sigma-70 family)